MQCESPAELARLAAIDGPAIAALVPTAVDTFGVGTSVVTGSGAPTAGFVYKLVAIAQDDAPDSPCVPVAKRSAGKTTVGGLQSGLVYGFAGQVDGIVGRIRDELGVEAQTVATGGLADLIAPHARTLDVIDPHLTLEGLRIVWLRNQ